MKLTWFGGAALRIHIGGQILVCGVPEDAAGVSWAELTSGADRVFGLGDALPAVDPVRWQPRRPTPLHHTGADGVGLLRPGPGSVLVDAVGEPPLLLLTRAPEIRARWAGDAVALVFDPSLAGSVLDTLQPRLIVIAAEPGGGDDPFAALADRLAGTALIALEKGMGIEA